MKIKFYALFAWEKERKVQLYRMDETHQLPRISENWLKMFSYFQNYVEKFMYSLLVAYHGLKKRLNFAS